MSCEVREECEREDVGGGGGGDERNSLPCLGWSGRNPSFNPPILQSFLSFPPSFPSILPFLPSYPSIPSLLPATQSMSTHDPTSTGIWSLPVVDSHTKHILEEAKETYLEQEEEFKSTDSVEHLQGG
eukprot:TRINITY_DN4295_c0_g1_i9.p1 TRINITY_DN4295_c0_g1~~TRINITY_DN4295_c0_g1_i9.p1  ORF type:complete len:127 (+),score=10.69 TRINITY_DN4295_c0_g1_i9:417-797(+)